MNFKAFLTEETEKGFISNVKERTFEDLPDGDVLIKVAFSSLNYKDALSASGNKGVSRNYPHSPGIDAAGIVEQSSTSDFLKGGAVIASACDFRLAEKNSLIGYPEIELGMNLSWLGLPLAISCLGLSEAKHVILSGEKFNAPDMRKKGFLNETFDLDEKNKCLRKWINKFKKLPGLQLKMIKKSANELAVGQAKSTMHMEFDQFLLSRNN